MPYPGRDSGHAPGATQFNSSKAKRALDQILTLGMEEPDSSGKERLVGVLTERETEVLQLLAYGKRNHEISAILCILGAEDRTQAVVTTIRMKLV